MKIRLLTIIILLSAFTSLQAERFIPWKSARIPVPEHFPTSMQVFDFIKKMKKEHPEYVDLIHYGYSTNGKKRNEKNLIALEIGDKSRNQKKIVFFSGGIHSREFMSVYSVLEWLGYLSKKLKEKDPVFLNYLKIVNLIVIPLINPDGYDMARKGWNWRKNTRIIKYRSPQFSPNSFGVDLNRNFPKFFVGVPFSFHYTWGGAKPLSEPETISLEKYLRGKKLSLSLSLHAYGRYVSYPWWGSRQSIPMNYLQKHQRIAKQLKKIMRKYNIRQGCPYPIRGNYGDWIFDRDKCLTFTIEIGDSFNPDKRTSEKWYREIEAGITHILIQAYQEN